MIVVADSGSTKTDWAFVDSDKSFPTLRFSTKGLNPYYIDTQHAIDVIRAAIPEHNSGQVKEVFFYGAGCSTPEKCGVIFSALKEVFPDAALFVHHDMLGAARATCGNDSGVVSILGTGSNSCVYDGEEISDSIPNLGFILGDEGSGGTIGRELLKCRVYREMPDELEKAFDEAFNFSFPEMMNKVYGEETPNRYVASYSFFCSQFKTHPFVQALLKQVFESFIQRNLLKYKTTQRFHFVGSISSTFKNELSAVMQEHDLTCGVFMSEPIDALIDFHSA